MRFSKKLNLETDSPFNFVCSLILLAVFAPFRLIVNLSKRIVYLTRDSLDKLFFLSVIMAILFTAAISVKRLATKEFSLLVGTFPIIIAIAGCALLLVLYLVFASVKFLAYSSTRDSEISESLNGDNPVLNDIPELSIEHENVDDLLPPLSVEQDMPDSLDIDLSDFKLTDDFVAPPNIDLLGDLDVQGYQNRLKDNILSAKDLIEADLRELTKLKPPNSTSIKDRLSNVIDRHLLDDDKRELESDLLDIPDDFELCN